MVPYPHKQAHEALCAHAPCYCPIAGSDDGDTGESLRYYVEQDHPEVRRTLVRPGCLTALKMRGDEPARLVVSLGSGRAEFLLVAGRGVPSGRTLSVIHLANRIDVADGDEFKYRIDVVGEAGVLSLSGQAKSVERLTKEYQASAFLFVPDAIWDSSPEDVPVFVQLK